TESITVIFDVEAPEITSPESGLITNDDRVNVEGTAIANSAIQIENNGEKVESGNVDDNGVFSLAVPLTEGDNELKAVSVVEDDPVAESETVTITLDATSPDITIDTPKDGATVTEENVTVSGSVLDDHLDWVRVNDKDVADDDGAFETDVTLDEGENDITVAAKDKAGNTSTETITVVYEKETPMIDQIEPTTDQTVFSGDAVTVSFESNVENGDASFQVSIPAAKQTNGSGAEQSMEEVEQGVYEGTWNVPKRQHGEGCGSQGGITEEGGE